MTQNSVKPIVLGIDGNFFVHRIRSAHNLTFTENADSDTNTLLWECTRSLCNEIKRLPMIQKIVIGRDFSSWRKQVKPVYPTYRDVLTTDVWKDEDEQAYKKNRDKERSYDIAKLMQAYDMWLDKLTTHLGIPVIKQYGAEADDVLSMLAHVSNTTNAFDVLLWTSDGDYVQLVSPNVSLLKFPKRELYVDDSYIKNKTTIFNMSSNNTIATLMSMFDKSLVQYVNPFSSIFKKIVYGDGKDNVPPTFYWLNKKGQRRRPSASYIEKAFDMLGIAEDSLTKDALYDTHLMQSFMQNLLHVCKQDAAKITEAFEIFSNNKRLKLLDEHQLPQELQNALIQDINDGLLHTAFEELSNFDATTSQMQLEEPVQLADVMSFAVGNTTGGLFNTFK